MNRIKQQKVWFLRIFVVLMTIVLAGCANGTTGTDAKENPNNQVQTDASIEANGSTDNLTDMDNATDINNSVDMNSPTDSDTAIDSDIPTDSDKQTASDELFPVNEFTVGEMPEWSEEELAQLQYVEKASIEDYYGDKTLYDAYILKGSSIGNGNVHGLEHGLNYSASAASTEHLSVYELLNIRVRVALEFWETESSGYNGIQVSQVMEKGDDRYQLVTATKEDIYGQPYKVTKFFYLDFQSETACVMWDVEIQENGVDKETSRVLKELGGCYGISLDTLQPDGDWLTADKERKEKMQDVYEPQSGERALEKLEGYQYLGTTTLVSYRKEKECPIILPMGWKVSVRESRADSSMHGVTVAAALEEIGSGRFMEELEEDLESRRKQYTEYTDRYRIVRSSSIEPIAGYREAVQAALLYEEKNTMTEEYTFGTIVFCRIRVDGNYALNCRITLSSNEYDDATNTLIKEVETAYGIDLSAYYNQ
ncbi:MAG: hypothetical protein NC094_09765 [Bacteroidales bacterium]|nr:hypothetical protein [Lachnoclostridium sp.]MCM1383612.1 hypothetical protein [Lachnoclostridium sp.]MCM1465694.1 hypothetical protein [Bacteroidales bacterium]